MMENNSSILKMIGLTDFADKDSKLPCKKLWTGNLKRFKILKKRSMIKFTTPHTNGSYA